MHSKRLWWSLIPVVILAVTAAIALVVLFGQTRLRVEVIGLPEGAVARIAVSGPSSYEFTGSVDDREVEPGRYTIRTYSVPTQLGTAYTATDESVLDIGGGQETLWLADYLVIIPDSTKVLDFANPGITAVANDALTFAAGSSSLPIGPGTIVVVAEGPQTPNPLARRVESVTNTAGGVVARTTSVPLVQALPAARFLLDDATEQALRFERVAIVREPMFTVRMPPQDSNGRACGALERFDLKLDVYSLRPKFTGDVGWKAFPPSVDLSFEASLNPEIGFTAEVRAGLECAWERGVDVPLKRLCGSAITRLARIGPVSLKCEVEPHVRAGVQAKVAAQIALDMDLHFGSDGLRATASQEAKDVISADINGSAAASLELGLDIALKGGDPSGTLWLGIELETALGPEYEIKAPPLTQQINLVLRFEIEVQMELDLRFKDWEKEKTILTLEKKIPVWHRDGKAPEATGAPSSAPPAKAPSDVDGDGRSDQVTVTGTAGKATVTVRLATGEVLTLLAFADEFAYTTSMPGLWSVVDIDGDRRAEIIYMSVMGSSTLWYSIVRYINGKLVQVLDPQGDAFQMPTGSAAAYFSAFGCRNGVIRKVGADRDLFTELVFAL